MMFGNLIDMHPTWPKEKGRLTEECLELLDEVKALDEENRVLRYNLATERSRYTLGGTPPGYFEPGAWHQEPVAPPPSATDESAPPLKRGLS